MKIGTDRGWSSHRTREPEVEGKLSRLGERTEQHQHDCGIDQRSRWLQFHQVIERGRAKFHLQDADTTEEAQPTRTRGEECAHRRLSR